MLNESNMNVVECRYHMINYCKSTDANLVVSDNSETYARDIKLLESHEIDKVELYDQFPNKNHLEIVSLLKKVK